jgi:hypothetical protein
MLVASSPREGSTLKIAAFNVENLFDRAKAFNAEDSGEAQRVIEAVAELNSLFEKSVYSGADKARMLELVDELELNRFNEVPPAFVRKIRGATFRRPRSLLRPAVRRVPLKE